MKVLRDNGLTMVLLLATVATMFGMLMTGQSVYNADLTEHGAQAITLAQYTHSAHFLSSLFENWESEFLQMSAYVVLTAFLFQRGSAESKDPDEPAPQVDDDVGATSPLVVRLGGITKTLYSYSLGIVLLALFLLSFAMHLRDSAATQASQALLHGRTPPTLWEHLWSAQMWFESFQNWQSEFLSTGLVVVLSIFLRFRGSPESKPVGAAHSETGD
jgi:hypothetical protein